MLTIAISCHGKEIQITTQLTPLHTEINSNDMRLPAICQRIKNHSLNCSEDLRCRTDQGAWDLAPRAASSNHVLIGLSPRQAPEDRQMCRPRNNEEGARCSLFKLNMAAQILSVLWLKSSTSSSHNLKTAPSSCQLMHLSMHPSKPPLLRL